jgi:cytochrome c oxidase assembly protein subunit 15
MVERRTNVWLHRFAVFTACVTFPLIFVGGLVKSHEAGLSVPDWPTTYGYNMFTFPLHWMVGNIFYEHGHRLFASFVGFCILVLALWLWRKESRPWVRKLGWYTLAAVCIQGALGGLTVYLLLPTWNSTAHAALAQITFCMTVALAMVTSKKWSDEVTKTASPVTDKLRTWTLLSIAAIFIQLLLGAVMRHEEAGLAIPTFPLAENGSLIPDFTSYGVALNFAHRLWAFVVGTIVIITGITGIKASKAQRMFRIPSVLGIVLVLMQITLGMITIWSAKDPNWTSLHVVGGAGVLATQFVLAMRVHHLTKRYAQSEIRKEYLKAGANA